MRYSVEWDNADKTVLLQTYAPGATKDDLYEVINTSVRMITSCAHVVHVIVDERNAQFLLNPVDFKYMDKTLPPNQGICVIVVLPGNITYKQVALSRVPYTTSHGGSYFVTSLEEARLFLQEQYGVHYDADRSA